MITSESNGQIKELIKLQKSARQRKKNSEFVAEGDKLVKEAYRHKKLKKIYISENVFEAKKEEFAEMLQSVSYEIVANTVFQNISETVTPQGILGIIAMPSYSLEELLQDEKQCFLLLDDIRDPGNLGTIMRTAEGAGMSAVLLSKESVDLFNPKVVRATMGAIFRMPFGYVESLPQVMETMKKKGIEIYGTMMDGSMVYDEADYTKGVGIVIGNEANGISEETKEKLSGRIRIPMEGSLESLNAAVAAAILMYETARQRRNL